jgi:hypothetical protein
MQMSTTVTENREEVEQARDELEKDLHVLKGRFDVRRGGKRAAMAAGAGAAVSAVVFGGAAMVRRRRGGPLTRLTRKLPTFMRSQAEPVARKADRALKGDRGEALKQGAEIGRTLLAGYAELHGGSKLARRRSVRRVARGMFKVVAAEAANQAVRRLLVRKRAEAH